MGPIGTRARSAAAVLGLLVAALGAGTRASALLISADFGNGFAGGAQPLFSGVEPKAAALDPAFGAANVWNDLTTGAAGVVTDPTFALLDSTGAATGVTFSITGTLDSYNGVSATASSLTRDYFYWNASLGISTTLSWAFSGLVPGAVYRLVFYGANTDVNRSFDLGIAGAGVVGAVPTASGTDPDPLYAIVTASAAGVVSGTAAADPAFEADWAGFQIASIPEPSTGFLLTSGLLGLLLASRKRGAPAA